jgi:hypothetical protein
VSGRYPEGAAPTHNLNASTTIVAKTMLAMVARLVDLAEKSEMEEQRLHTKRLRVNFASGRKSIMLVAGTL